MCANYEKQLVLEQAKAEQARDRASVKELALRQVGGKMSVNAIEKGASLHVKSH